MISILHQNRAIIISPEEQTRGPDFSREPVSRNNLKYLIVSDLHIGFEEKFKVSGLEIAASVDKMQSELLDIIEKHEISDLLINGDVKSGVDRILKSEWETVPRFFSSLVKKCRVSVIPGNHDGGLKHLLPESVQLLDINGVMISDNLMMHGHTSPLLKFKDAKRLIIGHVHPIFQRRGSPLSGQPVWIISKLPRKLVFKEMLDEPNSDSSVEIVLMPSFNLELVVAGFSADAATERRAAPLVKELRHSEQAVVAMLDGSVIGDASLLKDLL